MSAKRANPANVANKGRKDLKANVVNEERLASAVRRAIPDFLVNADLRASKALRENAERMVRRVSEERKAILAR